jgi:hypothetical protein
MFWAQPHNGLVISPWETQKSFLYRFIKRGTCLGKNDVALINLYFWIECMFFQQLTELIEQNNYYSF